MINNEYFLRYSRQILLKEIGLKGQKLLNLSKILIVGLGGLGSPAAMYLAAAGVGQLILADYDNLHVTNLQRQILYKNKQLGQLKTILAHECLKSINPDGQYICFSNRLEGEILIKYVKEVDLVLDCTDNITTRHDINAACVLNNKPLISASAIGFDGQLIILMPPWNNGCYACLFPSKKEIYYNCSSSGILGPIVGIMGSLQALEAIKIICKIQTVISKNNKILLFNGKSLQWNFISLTKNINCSICS
ncbi:MAG: HesA/MoeB/ThiF family protein (plasmid) [Pantoea sp. Brub]|nr:HesA/MoeB/ThiF family protein [Pantoea sp. Brub]